MASKAQQRQKTREDRKRESLRARVKHDPALWRAEAWASYAQVDGERTRAQCALKEGDCQVGIVAGHLDDALDAMAPLDPIRKADEGNSFEKFLVTRWRRFGRFWLKLKLYYSGASIERFWSAIHSASAALFMAYDESELPAQAARLRGLLQALPNLDWQLALVTEIINELEPQKEPKRRARTKKEVSVMRARLRQIHLDAMDASSFLQIEARTLRNTLLVASGALFAVLLLLGFTHMLNGCIFKICTNVDGHSVCPGGASAHSVDVFTVELAGMLGGLLSAVIPLATGERIKTPYRVFNHQMLLKILAGAATALAGVLLVESHVVSQIKFGSTATLLGYAVFFGFSQQVLTGLVDKRANDLGRETPTAKSV